MVWDIRMDHGILGGRYGSASKSKAFFVAYKSFMLRPKHASTAGSSVLVMGPKQNWDV